MAMKSGLAANCLHHRSQVTEIFHSFKGGEECVSLLKLLGNFGASVLKPALFSL